MIEPEEGPARWATRPTGQAPRDTWVSYADSLESATRALGQTIELQEREITRLQAMVEGFDEPAELSAIEAPTNVVYVCPDDVVLMPVATAAELDRVEELLPDGCTVVGTPGGLTEPWALRPVVEEAEPERT